MDAKQAVAIAKNYVSDLLADEQITNIGVEEVERDILASAWAITLGFSRPWTTPRTRAQEVLESLGGVSALKRSYKVVRLSEDGAVLSMKDRVSITTQQ